MVQWPEIDAFLSAQGIQIGPPTVGQTIGGTHTASSEHYEGRARDYARSNSAVAAIVAALKPYATGAGYVVDELFSTPENVFFADGQPFTPDATLRAQHVDHVHVGMRSAAHFGNAPVAGSTAPVLSSDAGAVSSLRRLIAHDTGRRLVTFGAGVSLLVVGLMMVVT